MSTKRESDLGVARVQFWIAIEAVECYCALLLQGAHKVHLRLAASLATLLFLTCNYGAIAADGVCRFGEDRLLFEFLNAANVNREKDGQPRFARWGKRDLSIGVFHDVSARPPEDPTKRNMSIFKAVGSIGSVIRFSVGFKSVVSDIEIVFLSQRMQEAALQRLPPEAISAERAGGCPVYLLTDGSERPELSLISKARILVSSGVSLDALPTCIGTALVNAVGLLGWSLSSDRSAQTEDLQRFQVFMSALYDSPALASPDGIREAVEAAKYRICSKHNP